jgi:putative peptidoglycan lipid II flippase
MGSGASTRSGEAGEAREAGSEAPRAVARHRELVGRTVLVSVLTLVSRLLGFAREALMAAVFGERSIVSDAFITAWRFPNLFRRLLGEGALSTALQSAMTKADIERGDAAGRALFLATLRVMSAVLVLVTAAGMLVTLVLPDRMPLTGWAWLGADPEPVRDLTVRVLPYVVLVCAAAICGGALAVRGHFALPNLAPTAMNVVWIATLIAIGVGSGWGREVGETEAEVVGTQWEMARWLAWGLLLGGLVQLFLHLVPLRRYELVGGPADGERADPWQVLRATGPLVIGAAIYQINTMIDGLMAESLLATGGPSALYYANRVQQFPLALVSTAAVNAVFPALNAHGHLGERARVRALHDRTQLGILLLALPAAAGMFALALPIASVCYEHGNYGAEGTARVAEGLRCLALALVPAGAAALSSRVFVAMGDLRTPVRIALWMLLVNVSLNTLCVVGFGLDVAGLTLSTALTTWVNLFWLLRGLRTRLGLARADPALRARSARIMLAALLSALAAWGAQRACAAALESPEPRRSIPALLVGLGAGAVAYALAARALGIPEWEEVVRRARARLAARR